GVCWEVVEGRGGVVRKWWSGTEIGEVVLQGLAGILVVNSSYLNRGWDNRDDIGNLHNWSMWLTRTNSVSPCRFNSLEIWQDKPLIVISLIAYKVLWCTTLESGQN
nr:hypothetical protein [Tanacetum cinerariifolium]